MGWIPIWLYCCCPKGVALSCEWKHCSRDVQINLRRNPRQKYSSSTIVVMFWRPSQSLDATKLIALALLHQPTSYTWARGRPPGGYLGNLFGGNGFLALGGGKSVRPEGEIFLSAACGTGGDTVGNKNSVGGEHFLNVRGGYCPPLPTYATSTYQAALSKKEPHPLSNFPFFPLVQAGPERNSQTRCHAFLFQFAAQATPKETAMSNFPFFLEAAPKATAKLVVKLSFLLPFAAQAASESNTAKLVVKLSFLSLLSKLPRNLLSKRLLPGAEWDS